MRAIRERVWEQGGLSVTVGEVCIRPPFA
jgi:hypothetical protein